MQISCCKAERNPFPSKIFTNSIIRWPVVLKEQVANNYTFLILPLFFEQHSVTRGTKQKKAATTRADSGVLDGAPCCFSWIFGCVRCVAM